MSALGLASCASQPSATDDPPPAEARAPAEPAPEGIQPTVISDEAASRPEFNIEPTVVSYPEVDDPLIRFNRAIFTFNDWTYRYALIPAARGYQKVPEPVRTGIGNVFDNIKMPIRAVNYLFQAEPAAAGRDVARFLVNSTVGVLGIFDVAESWLGLEDQSTGLADTLTRYGVGHGTYIVLPFYGPSTLRDGAGLVGDFFLNPIPYALDQPESTITTSFDGFQEFAPAGETYIDLREEAEDPYVFFRNLYMEQLQRDADYPRWGAEDEGAAVGAVE